MGCGVLAGVGLCALSECMPLRAVGWGRLGSDMAVGRRVVVKGI